MNIGQSYSKAWIWLASHILIQWIWLACAYSRVIQSSCLKKWKWDIKFHVAFQKHTVSSVIWPYVVLRIGIFCPFLNDLNAIFHIEICKSRPQAQGQRRPRAPQVTKMYFEGRKRSTTHLKYDPYNILGTWSSVFLHGKAKRSQVDIFLSKIWDSAHLQHIFSRRKQVENMLPHIFFPSFLFQFPHTA